MLNELKRIRYATTQIQGIVSDLLRAIAGSDLLKAERPRCPVCGTSDRSEYAVAEHLHRSHGGPVPKHILDAEARADL